MASAIKLPSARQAVVELDQERQVWVFTRQWFLFFQQMYDRVGGATGEDNNSIVTSNSEDAVSSETQAMLFTAEKALQQSPLPPDWIPPDQLSAQIDAVRDSSAEQVKSIEALEQMMANLLSQITELTKDVDGIRQGYLI